MQKIFKTGSQPLCILLVAVALFFQACESQEQKPVADKAKYVIPDTVLHTLKIDTVITSQLMNALTLTGKVVSNEDNVIPVYAMVSGNGQDIKVLFGDYVKADQVLPSVKSSEMAGYGN